MSRKDYVLIAGALAESLGVLRAFDESLGDDQSKGAAFAAKCVADALEKDNVRFDRARFLKAAGVTS